MKINGKPIGLRDRRKPGHGWYDNEIYDVFGDELRQDGISVYMTLTRLCYGVRVTMSLREMAAQARMSKDTFARTLKRVVALGLVIEQKGATAQSASTYELVDVKDLAVEYLRKVSQGETELPGDKKISVSPGATEVSQKEGDSATEVSQAVRHPLRQRHKDYQDSSTPPQPPIADATGGVAIPPMTRDEFLADLAGTNRMRARMAPPLRPFSEAEWAGILRESRDRSVAQAAAAAEAAKWRPRRTGAGRVRWRRSPEGGDGAT